MSGRFEGRVAVITGGAAGIGRATAERMAAEGAKVAVWDVSADALADCPFAALTAQVDQSHEAAVIAAAQDVVAKLGKLDILVVSAGITGPNTTLETYPSDAWRKVMAINVDGTFYCNKAVIPHMRERRQGSIVCMSSVSAQRGGGIFGGPHYSAAKAGVLGLAKAMARELGPDGIRVNCVTPGLIQTDITGGKLTDEMRRDIIKGIPLARLGTADDIAGIYLFLASDLSAYVTGSIIMADGGYRSL